MFRSTFILSICLIFLSSCGPKLSHFTQQLYEEQNWTQDELKRIQFYLSEDLVLTRELRGGSSEIRSGQVKIINGKEIEQMVFKRNTPGVFVFSPKSKRMAISFEGGDDNYLVFGANPKADNRYTLLASEWNRRSGQVTYKGKKWKVYSNDAFASLLIPLKRIRTKDVSGKVARGRKL